MDKWDARFLGIARREVAAWSKDPNEGVGCVLVSPDRRQLAVGYNGLPQGVADTAERLDDRELKNQLTVHAELNAILNARTNLTGWTLYVTKHPCMACAKAVIQAGIARVVCAKSEPFSNWRGEHDRAHRLLAEAGVDVHLY
jgi:dCMP deaminase